MKKKLSLSELIANHYNFEASIEKLLEWQVESYVGFHLDYSRKALRIFINAEYAILQVYIPEELLDDVFSAKTIETVILDFDNGTWHLTNKDRTGKFNESDPREMMGS